MDRLVRTGIEENRGVVSGSDLTFDIKREEKERERKGGTR
jgi:hypothetical protein